MTLSVHCDVYEPREPKYELELAKYFSLSQFVSDTTEIPVFYFQSSISG